RKEKYAALSSCQCLSECNALEYDVELVKTRKISLGKTNSTAIMKVFFKENQFVPLKRFQLYGTIDFLANCGGLLGLFVGVSVLSLIEILYYFILRLTCIWNNSREYKDEDVIKKNKKSSESSVKNLTVGNLYQHNWQRPMEKY
ncbi:CLUMA_CG015123, isoform A, partial [Clunio marinus]